MVAPPSVGATLLIDLDADTLSGVADGGAVSSWASTVGSVALTQATSANQPLKRAGILNNHAVVEFDGVNDALTNTASGISGVTGTTVLMVMTQTAAGTVTFPGAFSAGTSSTSSDYINTAGGGFMIGGAGTGAAAWDTALIGGAATNSQTTPDLMTSSRAYGTYATVTLSFSVASASTTNLYVNGTAEGTTTSTALTSVPLAYLVLGARYEAAVMEWGKLRVARLLLYGGRLSDADRVTVEGFLGSTYFLSSSKRASTSRARFLAANY